MLEKSSLNNKIFFINYLISNSRSYIKNKKILFNILPQYLVTAVNLISHHHYVSI